MAASSPATAVRALQRTAPGDHVCAFPRTVADRRRLAAVFVRSGLASASKVIYASPHADDEMLGILHAEGVGDASDAHRRGQHVFIDFASHDGVAGRFSAGSAAARYRAAATAASDEGYAGVHVAGEMSWFAHAGVPLDELLAWERSCTAMCADHGAIGFRQYERRRFDERLRDAVAAAHTATAIDDGPPPLATLTYEPSGVLRVAGEVDMSNAAILERAMRAQLRTTTTLQVDMAAVAFLDLAALRVFRDLSRELPAGGRISLRRVPGHVRPLMELARIDGPGLETRED